MCFFLEVMSKPANDRIFIHLDEIRVGLPPLQLAGQLTDIFVYHMSYTLVNVQCKGHSFKINVRQSGCDLRKSKILAFNTSSIIAFALLLPALSSSNGA